jgi:hypothetical protein
MIENHGEAVASLTREQWMEAYDMLADLIPTTRIIIHVGAPVYKPPTAGKKWKPQGFVVWVDNQHATASTLKTAITRARTQYENWK